MIPIHDVTPLRRTPVLLVLANVAVFLLAPAARGPGATAVCRQTAFPDHYAAVPRELIENRPLPRVATGDVTETSRGRLACAAGRPSHHKVPALPVLGAERSRGGIRPVHWGPLGEPSHQDSGIAGSCRTVVG
ncbi:hypothetical protein [Actinomadura kijaniata]|uniref:hypothetical protein n=1 Tax=Actinomadura kijaniata TaxID=46161 RepID=UPI00083220CA|nr:hypothetical protein [Actinomadura kijaniata]